ncbi:uncharacterized protein [Malus domestica]|uniref:uncharacterized protein n=1 Tax=Malus domestica TaxID=3750 RepID=UPI0039771ED9
MLVWVFSFGDGSSGVRRSPLTLRATATVFVNLHQIFRKSGVRSEMFDSGVRAPLRRFSTCCLMLQFVTSRLLNVTLMIGKNGGRILNLDKCGVVSGYGQG